MNQYHAGPLSNPETGYRIELRGRVDLEWLKSLDSTAEVSIDETMQTEAFTVFTVRTDQTGIVGLLRRLHGLGMTIQQFEIIG